MNCYVTTFILAICIGASTGTAHAAMRCGTNLINEGDTTAWVIQMCGEPAKREVIEPTVTANTRNLSNAVTVENWVYGPDNGAYRNLKFLDGVLVKIEFRR